MKRFFVVGVAIAFSTIGATEFHLKNNADKDSGAKVNFKLYRVYDTQYGPMEQSSHPFQVEPGKEKTITLENKIWDKDGFMKRVVLGGKGTVAQELTKAFAEKIKEAYTGDQDNNKLSGIEFSYGPGMRPMERYNFNGVTDETTYFLKFDPNSPNKKKLEAQKGTILTRGKMKNKLTDNQIQPAELSTKAEVMRPAGFDDYIVRK